jgi:hypothetical protein
MERKFASRRRSGRRRRNFSPPEPTIVNGQFVGKKLSELSDEELRRFLQADAGWQITRVAVLPPPFTPCFRDMSQYWFAKYELERRKPEAQRTPTSLDIVAGEPKSGVALKLAEYGYRTASRRYHPDCGGDTATMQLLNDARQFAKERLKS